MFAAVIIAVWMGGNFIIDKYLAAQKRKKTKVYKVHSYDRNARKSA